MKNQYKEYSREEKIEYFTRKIAYFTMKLEKAEYRLLELKNETSLQKAISKSKKRK